MAQCNLVLSNDSLLHFVYQCQSFTIENPPSTIETELPLMGTRSPSTSEIALTVSIFMIITMVCMVGNFVIILALILSRSMLIPQNYYLVSLAIADLCCSIMLLPFHSITYFYQTWLFGIHFCRVFLMFDISLCTASILNLVLVTCDRYFSIRFPIRFSKYRKKFFILVFILTAWFISLTIALPVFIFDPKQLMEILPDNRTVICQMSTNRIFVIFSSTGSYWLPIVIICILNYKIYVSTIGRLRSRRRAAQAMTIKATTTPNLSSTSQLNVPDKTLDRLNQTCSVQSITATVSNSEIENNLKKREKLAKSRERRLTRTLLLITTLFMLCWTPFFTVYVLAAFIDSILSLDQVFHNFVLWLGYANSALNPVMYTASNKDIRNAIIRLVKR